jgi:hypothetical protein
MKVILIHTMKSCPSDLDDGCVVLDVLRPEWDVLIEIQEALRSLPGVTLQYVKGHQDCNNDDYQQLSLMAQLNVRCCHHMAGEFQDSQWWGASDCDNVTTNQGSFALIGWYCHRQI